MSYKPEVGDFVRYAGSSTEFYLGELDGHQDCAYLWSNDSNFDGSKGKLSPKGAGYKYSYAVRPGDVSFIRSGNLIGNMSILEKFKVSLMGEPEKSFRLAGITNGDDLLTSDGTQIFLSWMLKKHGPDFKKEVVDGLLAEEEKSKK